MKLAAPQAPLRRTRKEGNAQNPICYYQPKIGLLHSTKQRKVYVTKILRFVKFKVQKCDGEGQRMMKPTAPL